MPMCFIPTCQHCNTTCKWLRFPANVETKTKWLNNIGRFRLPEMPAKNSFICSCHFVDGKRENGPTIFSWTNTKEPITSSLDDPSHNLRAKLRQNYALIGKTINIKTKNRLDNKNIEKNGTQEKNPLAMDSTEISAKRTIAQYLGNQSVDNPNSSNIIIKNEDNPTIFVEIKNENDSFTSSIEIKNEDNPTSFVEINSDSSNESLETDDNFYKNLQLNLLPLTNWGTQSLKNNTGYIFTQIELVNEIPLLRKCIAIAKNCATIYLDRKKLYTEIFHSRYELIHILYRVDNQKICLGGPSFNAQDPPLWLTTIASKEPDYNRWRHKKCIYLYEGPENSCCFCLKLFTCFVIRQLRLKKTKKQKEQMKQAIRHKFECFKEKQKEKSAHLLRMKSRIKNKFECLDKTNDIEEGVDLIRMKNIIKNKVECLDKTNDIEETVDLLRMKNIIKNKVECVREENEGEQNVDLTHMKHN